MTEMLSNNGNGVEHGCTKWKKNQTNEDETAESLMQHLQAAACSYLICPPERPQDAQFPTALASYAHDLQEAGHWRWEYGIPQIVSSSIRRRLDQSSSIGILEISQRSLRFWTLVIMLVDTRNACEDLSNRTRGGDYPLVLEAMMKRELCWWWSSLFLVMAKLVGWILQLKMQSAKTHSEKLTEVHSHDKTTK